jgi:hypothetical protein
MQSPVPPPTIPANPASCEQVFSAKAVQRGGVVRRAIRDIDREIGRAVFEAEVRRRGFHLICCSGQSIVVCNAGMLHVIC